MTIDMLQRNIWLNSGKLDESKAYWLRKLEGRFRLSRFPADRSLPAFSPVERGELVLDLSESVANRMLSVAGGSDSAVYVILLAGIQYLLSAYTDQRDAAIGMPAFRAQHQGSIVLNTAVPLWQAIDPGRSFKELLGASKQTVTEAVTHQNYPIELLAERFGLPVHAEGFPMLPVFVVYDEVHLTAYLSSVQADLVFRFGREGSRLSLTLSYPELMYSRQTAEQLAERLLAIYEQGLQQPNVPLEQLSIWTASEREDMSRRAKLDAGDIAGSAGRTGAARPFHPLMRRFVEKSAQRWILETEVSVEDCWELEEHRIQGHYLLPGTSFLDMAAFAARAYGEDATVELRDVRFHAPLLLGPETVRRLRTVIDIDSGVLRIRSESCRSQAGADADWTVHATCLATSRGDSRPPMADLLELRRNCSQRSVTIEQGGANPRTAGFGLRWQGIESYAYGHGESLISLELDERFHGDLATYTLHPALLELCTSSYVEDEHVYLPLSYKRVQVYAPLSGRLYSHLSRKPEGHEASGTVGYDIKILSAGGEVLVEIEDFTLKRVQDLTVIVKALNLDHNRLHRVVWVPWGEETVGWQARPVAGTVLLFGGAHTVELARLYRERGWQLIEVESGSRFEAKGTDHYTVGDSAEDYRKLAEVVSRNPLSHIVHHLTPPSASPSTTPEELEAAQNQGVWSVYHLVRALDAIKLRHTADLYIVTSRAYPVAEDDRPLPEQAALSGLGKVIGEEHLQLRTYGIDLDEAMSPEHLYDQLMRTERPSVTAYRNGQAYIEMLDVLELPAEEESSAYPIKPGGTYLITGGTGGLGIELARFLGREHPVQLALVSRKTVPDRSEWAAIVAEGTGKHVNLIRTIQHLEQHGSRVALFAADTADWMQMQGVVSEIRALFGPIDGVIHAAGVAGDGFLARREAHLFREVLQPKVTGTWVLDQVTAEEPLSFFVLFSSIATFGGAAGQADYTAGNSYLDAFAAYRRSRGKTALSVNWTSWKETGMAVDYGAAATFFQAIGTKDALDMLSSALQSGQSRVVIGELNAGHAAYDQLERLPIRFSEVVLQQLQLARSAVMAAASVGQPAVEAFRVKGASTSLESQVGQAVCTLLGIDEVHVEDDFFEIGGHSILAIKLIVELEKQGLPASGLDVYEDSTIQAMAAFLELG
ncbi:SDR family NAD(P)-dependent oxidoreductase [Paenibacillus filicis]|uniref:SDR family NAD(P)-dependent oxidoreductase n=1 Tax=Paenibacillus filicis TaxID=669464 RepID=A0ABU9DEC2_9BACL